MVFDTATVTEVGSFGTDADCANALNAVGAPGSGLDFPSAGCTAGVGCAYDVIVNRVRCQTPATDANATYVDLRRVCACH
jgi:hypothetical protein